MKFQTTVNEIKKALALLFPIVNYNHSSLPFRYLLVRKYGEGKVEIKAFGESTVASAFVSCSEMSGEDTKVYVLAKHFIGLIKNFHGDKISFVVSDDACRIVCKKSKYSLKTLQDEVAEGSLSDLDIDYYGFIGKEGAEVNVNSFKTAFSSIQHWTGKDFESEDFQYVYFAEGCVAACCDVGGAYYPFDTKGIEHLALHKKACACISNMKNQQFITLFKGTGKVYGCTDKFIFVSATTEVYPYSQFKTFKDNFTEGDFAFSIKFPPDEMEDKLSRLLMFAGDSYEIKVRMNDSDFVLSSEHQGEAKEYINLVESYGEDFVIDVDGKRLLSAIGKEMGEVTWSTMGSDDVQYLSDGCLVQFFLGLEKKE